MARGNPLYRQWQLLKTIQSHRYGIGSDELAERLECSKRTIQRDMIILQTIFPIQFEEHDFGKKQWKLSPQFIESEKLELSMMEMLSLYLSQQLLTPLAGTPFGDGLATAIQKIKALLPTQALAYFANLDDAFMIKSLGQEDYSGKGKEIAILNDAIVYQRVVRVTYPSSSQGRELRTLFHPYGMVLLSSSLYCIGWLAEYGEVRTLKVSRFKAVRGTDETFEKPTRFSLVRHTLGSFGVFGPGTVRTIRVRFADWAATNVREHKWHHSQRILTDDANVLVAEFDLSSTVEFKRWLLGFGRHAVALKPKNLVNEIAEELQAARSSYGQ